MAESEDIRLNKYLGLCLGLSRRAADRLLETGRVQLNGVVAKPGQSLNPERDELIFDGQTVRPPQRLQYLMLNKPEDCLVTRQDPQGRRTVYHLIPTHWQHLHPVGRLDRDSCGLLLLTNDGALSQRLLHPRHKVLKSYRVRVNQPATAAQLQQLCQGIALDEGRTQPARIVWLPGTSDRSWLRFEIREGKKRQIRRMCKAVGLRVLYLQRDSLGPIQLGQLAEGQCRLLSAAEIQQLQRATGLQ
ncbi:MAG: rRNA pseudouridine synthase [Candidatus Sericytochromatia bacterium]|nr:rRNA pseudouridine synthase [Candidatus Sericytochromatia bacterium]